MRGALVAELSGTSGQVVPVRVDGPTSASAIELSMEPGRLHVFDPRTGETIED